MKKTVLLSLCSILGLFVPVCMGILFFQMFQAIAPSSEAEMKSNRIEITKVVEIPLEEKYENKTGDVARIDELEMPLKNIPNERETIIETSTDQPEDGIVLDMKNYAISMDGSEFTCYIANAQENNYDMFVCIYSDKELNNEVMRSGRIPVGGHIEQFTVDHQIAPGIYDCYLLYNQLEDDFVTVRASSLVAFTLAVSE